MIVRLMGEGQWQVDDGVRARIDELDIDSENAVKAGEKEAVLIDGQLTGSVHAEAQDADLVALLATALSERSGRLIFDGFPTGVAVTHGMHHGGPFPATTAPAHTSVGMTAIRRFLRPVAFQNAPAHVLPPELQDANPLGIWRRVEGELTREPLAQPE